MTRSFALRYALPARWLLTAFGMGPKRAGIFVTPDEVRVHAGRFQAAIQRERIVSVGRTAAPWWALIGVHTDFRGRWIINGSPHGIVRLDLADGAQSRLGGVPIQVRRLDLSLDDPEGFMREPAWPTD
jgi:hypothetical protein